MKKRLKKKYHRAEYDAREAEKKALQRKVEAIKEIQGIDWADIKERMTIAFDNLWGSIKVLMERIESGIKSLSEEKFSSLMAQLPHEEQKVVWRIRNTESESER